MRGVVGKFGGGGGGKMETEDKKKVTIRKAI